MTGNPSEYRAASVRSLHETPGVRESVGAATRTFDGHRTRAYSEIDSDRWRDWARDTKAHVLAHLDRYLEEAELHLLENGVEVHWTETAQDALEVLERIVRKHSVRTVVKGKSMVTEELGVNAHLESIGVRPVETDLGEYIIQLLGEPPSHIVGPAIHKSLQDCQELFHEHLETPLDADPDTLAAAARAALRTEFLAADMGISGGNFLAADTGTIALIENEGNIRLSTSLPDVHVAFIGIEKIVPRFEDLSGFLQLTSRAATGQPIGNFVSLIQGPRTSEEFDGPTEVHVVFVDNGRSALFAEEDACEALRCLRCGACLNICPVYRQTGGHAYGWTYSGPIGSILAPGLLGLENAIPLPHASTLCGACTDVCPVRIPIPKILLHWRQRAVAEGLVPFGEGLVSRSYAEMACRPDVFELAGSALRRSPWQAVGRSLPVLGGWMQERAAPTPSPRSFRELWQEGIS